MLRIDEPTQWLLVTHPDHAGLAGDFAEAWGNEEFAAPEPRSDVLVAVRRHDDAWRERDAQPTLTRDGRPAGFSSELVGSYNAFEDIELADYLRVRGKATEAVAADNALAAILVSMHTLNLLTDQADLTKLSPEDLTLHRHFVEEQRKRQHRLITEVSTAQPQNTALQPDQLDRAFRFLQACDSLSLTACVRYAKPIALRHSHPRRDGSSTVLQCQPLGHDVYRVHPYPFRTDDFSIKVPFRRIARQAIPNPAALRLACAKAPWEFFTVRIVRSGS